MFKGFSFVLIGLLIVCAFFSSAQAEFMHNEYGISVDLDTGESWVVFETTVDALGREYLNFGPMMTLSEAESWIKILVAQSYGGITNWELPKTPDGDWGYNGSNAGKYDVDVSDIGRLYYETLGLLSREGESTPNTESEIAKKDEILNLLPECYWFGTETTLKVDHGWVFDIGWGSQFLQSDNLKAYAIAVSKSSPSSAPIPEPASALLFLTSLLFLARIPSLQKN